MIYSDHKVIAFTYWVFRKILGPVIRLLWVKKVIGKNNIPKKGAAILAFNHQSFFDFLCFAAVCDRNVHFLTAEKFFESWFWKPLMILTGQIKVVRHDHEKTNLRNIVTRHINSGTLVGIFPEGTRSPYIDQMLKAFTGVAKFSLQHHIPVIPIGIKGTFEVMSRHMKAPNFKKVVEIHIGGQLYFDKYHDRHAEKDVCVYVTEKIIREIEKLSEKKYLYYESKFE